MQANQKIRSHFDYSTTSHTTTTTLQSVRTDFQSGSTGRCRDYSSSHSICSEPGSETSTTEIQRSGLRHSVHQSSIHVIDYYRSHSANVSEIYAYNIADDAFDAEFSEPVVEVLLSYGWDIDAQKNDTNWLLIWYFGRQANVSDLVNTSWLEHAISTRA